MVVTGLRKPHGGPQQKWNLGRCRLQTTELHRVIIQEGMWGSWEQTGGGGDWACVLLGLTSHSLLWSQQNGPQGPHLRHHMTGINPADDWGSWLQLLDSDKKKKKTVGGPIENERGVFHRKNELLYESMSQKRYYSIYTFASSTACQFQYGYGICKQEIGRKRAEENQRLQGWN